MSRGIVLNLLSTVSMGLQTQASLNGSGVANLTFDPLVYTQVAHFGYLTWITCCCHWCRCVVRGLAGRKVAHIVIWVSHMDCCHWCRYVVRGLASQQTTPICFVQCSRLVFRFPCLLLCGISHGSQLVVFVVVVHASLDLIVEPACH